MRTNGFWIFASAILLAASVVPARANLITDPGFESCTGNGATPPGWTSVGDAGCNSAAPHTGNWGVIFSGLPNTLSQTITTIAGDNYDFSFWLDSGLGSPSFITASFGSDEVLDLVNPGLSPGYIPEDFTVAASGTSTTVTFSGEANGGGWALDDVSVTDQGPAAPEPASLLLMGAGLLGIAWRFRRQRS
jgi:hypothetical protein